MRILKIIIKEDREIDDFDKINNSLIGKHVFINHSVYPLIQNVVKGICKISEEDAKQIFFESADSIIIRKGDEFTIEVLK